MMFIIWSTRRSPKPSLTPRFSARKLKPHVLHEVVVWQETKHRRGTAKVKTRGEVSGTGKKPWRQKGTGRSRHGSLRSPLWPGGGKVFGPIPKDYDYTIPKKIRKAALKGALSLKVKENRLYVLDKIKMDEIKTAKFQDFCDSFELDRALVVHRGQGRQGGEEREESALCQNSSRRGHKCERPFEIQLGGDGAGRGQEGFGGVLMRELYQVIKRPVVTEKSNSLNEKLNQVVFEVDWDASKSEIKHAVEKIFNVKVEKVRTMRVAGKVKNYGRKSVHRKSAWKKAFVTLKEGSKINFYEGIK